MSEFQVHNLCVEAEGKTVVDGASFAVRSGEIHVLMGPNGSGKSSLLNAIMGHPKYKITRGNVLLDGEDITDLPTEKKAQAGIFLSLQHLPEIAGVTLTNFLHKAYRAQKGGEITPLDFYKMMDARAKEFGIDANFLKKHVNAGLSGGEKKQSEVLQLLALEPKFALLDEIDSGVDVDAQKRVFAVIEHLRAKGVGFVLVSHHSNLLQHLTPDHVHVMKDGKLILSGDKMLAAQIAAKGFDTLAS
jgi:Fe-S cluster assembly ATP-binding protein